ncbi:MAG: hypothetical protein AAGH60_05370 [Pseudomonadota bacterium]
MKTMAFTALIAVSMAFAVPAFGEDHEGEREAEEDHLEELMSYLELSEQFVGLADRPEAAVFFAVEGIVEIYEHGDNLPEAISVLENALNLFPNDQAARNIIRFQLRDLYAESNDTESALEQLQAVLEENQSQ